MRKTRNDAITGGVRSEQVAQHFRGAGHLDGRHPHGKAGAGLALLFADAAEQPADGGRDQAGTRVVRARANHRRRFA